MMEPKIIIIKCNKKAVGALLEDNQHDIDTVQLIRLGKANFNTARYPADPPLGPPYPGYSMMEMIKREKGELR